MTTNTSSQVKALPRLLTIGDVAEHLGVSTKTVRRMMEGGELHAHKVGRQWRITEEDLRLYLAAQRK